MSPKYHLIKGSLKNLINLDPLEWSTVKLVHNRIINNEYSGATLSTSYIVCHVTSNTNLLLHSILLMLIHVRMIH